MSKKMEWRSGFRILRQLWKKIQPRKEPEKLDQMTDTPKLDLDLSIPSPSASSLSPPPPATSVSIEDQQNADEINSGEVLENGDQLGCEPELEVIPPDERISIHSECSSETTVTINTRPCSAHIPYRPIALFDRYVAIKEPKGTDRESTEEQKPVTSPEYYSVLAGKVVNSMTPPQNVIIDGNSKSDPHTQTPSSRTDEAMSAVNLSKKEERLPIPRRADIFQMINKPESSVVRERLRESAFSGFRRGKVAREYPYFVPESMYGQLRQEERLKEMRRELRAELETQLDCDVGREFFRRRHTYQTPVIPKAMLSSGTARILTMPLPLPTQIRLGIVRRPKRVQLCYWSQIRSFKIGKRRKISAARQNTLELEKLAKEHKAHVGTVLQLFRMAAHLMYNYTAEPNDENKQEKPSTEAPIYMDILEGLLVQFRKKARRKPQRQRGRSPGNRQQIRRSSSRVSDTVSLSKAALEGLNWREGLTTQGVRIADQMVGRSEEGFVRQLITLERLQLLTRLEETECVMDSAYELQYIMRSRSKPKRSRSCAAEWSLNSKSQPLPPLLKQRNKRGENRHIQTAPLIRKTNPNLLPTLALNSSNSTKYSSPMFRKRRVSNKISPKDLVTVSDKTPTTNLPTYFALPLLAELRKTGRNQTNGPTRRRQLAGNSQIITRTKKIRNPLNVDECGYAQPTMTSKLRSLKSARQNLGKLKSPRSVSTSF
ncbi:unnamed protein product [Calicophoron daubneyi]|uniref:Uncharacterized protein n=1 Tax=Calicophoron daubneyi TaxID=300641 RepID=A0AAV2TU48_CALDB